MKDADGNFSPLNKTAPLYFLYNYRYAFASFGVAVFIIMPLALKKKLDDLKIFSLLGLAMTLYTLMFLCFDAAENDKFLRCYKMYFIA